MNSTIAMSAPLWKDKVKAILAEHIARKTFITYQDLAVQAGIPAPQTIHQLTLFLEDLMEQDFALGKPLRAAIVVSRISGIPAEGFFLKLAALDYVSEPHETPEQLHQRLINQL